MSVIFWALVMITVVFCGAFIYRISSGVRQYNRDREQRIGHNFGISSQEGRDAEFDLFLFLFLFRWGCTFATITSIWGLCELAFRLFS